MKSHVLAAMLIAAALTVTGCAASRPTSYYLLEPVPEAGTPRGDRPDWLVLGIRPIEIPSYLDRRHILVRTAENRLKLSELDQWAEPLDESIARITARNLEALTCARTVRLLPGRPQGPVDHVLEIHIHRMEAGPGQEAILDASWRISEAQGKNAHEPRVEIREAGRHRRLHLPGAGSHRADRGAFPADGPGRGGTRRGEPAAVNRHCRAHRPYGGE